MVVKCTNFETDDVSTSFGKPWSRLAKASPNILSFKHFSKLVQFTMILLILGAMNNIENDHSWYMDWPGLGWPQNKGSFGWRGGLDTDIFEWI